jgi:predicted DNA-binding transcriptional regulator AlpA
MTPRPEMRDPDVIGFRDERYAANYLGISIETLHTWRQKNRGPRWRKFGRCVRYSLADLAEFVQNAPAGGGE